MAILKPRGGRLSALRFQGVVRLDALPPFLERVLRYVRVERVGGGVQKTVEQLYTSVPAANGKPPFYIVHAGMWRTIVECCAHNGWTVETLDKRRPLPAARGDLDAFSWRPGQREAVEAILASEGLGHIDAPTAFGKSYIIRALSILWPASRVLVVTMSSDVQQGMVAELRKTFSEDEMSVVGGISTRKMQLNRRICVAMAHSLSNVPGDWPDVILVDEIHRAGSVTLANGIASFYQQPRFGFSASAGKREDGGSELVTALFGQCLFARTYQEAQADGMLPPVDVCIYTVDGCREVRGCYGDADWKRKNLWGNSYRNELIARIAVKLLEQGDSSVLVLCETTEQVLRLRAFLPPGHEVVYGDISTERWEGFQKMKVLLPEDTPKMDPEPIRLKVNGGWKGIVVATLKWAEGVDMPPLKYVVRADAQASRIKSDQAPGRAVRPKALAVVVDFLDAFSPYRLAKQSEKRFEEYKLKGWNLIHVK